jgi:hypothetical protein
VENLSPELIDKGLGEYRGLSPTRSIRKAMVARKSPAEKSDPAYTTEETDRQRNQTKPAG